MQAYEAYKKRREEEREAYKMKFYPSQLQNFGNTSLPKETKSVGGQSYPSWAEAQEEYMARANRDKSKLAEGSSDEFTTPTFAQLPAKYQQAFEVLKKKRAEEFEVLKKKMEEEDNAKLEKDLQDIINSSRPCSNQVKPSATAR